MKRLSLDSMLYTRQPDSCVAIAANGKSYRFSDFQQSVLNVIAQFNERSELVDSVSVVLFCKDTYQFSVLLTALACLKKKIILPQNGTPGAIKSLQNKADIAIVDEDLCRGLAEDSDHSLVVIDITDLMEAKEKSPSSMPETLRNYSVDDQAISVTVFTSGSTGEAKEIEKTLRHFTAEVEAIEQLWGDVADQALIVATVSHQHVYGLLFRLLWPLLSGRSFTAEQVLYPEDLYVRKYNDQPSLLVSSPAFLSRFPEHCKNEVDGNNVASLDIKTIFSSGGPLDQTHSFKVQELVGCSVVEVFGSSETGGVGWRSRSNDADPMAWQPLPNVDVSLEKETQLLQVMSPYVFSSEPYVMGDVAELLLDGSFVVKGRSDRIAKVEEKRFSLEEMEALISQCEEVDACRVLVLRGKRRVQVAAVLVLSGMGESVLAKHGKLKLTQGLRGALSDSMDRVVLPRKWRFVDQIPMNAQGKVQQSELERLFT